MSTRPASNPLGKAIGRARFAARIAAFAAYGLGAYVKQQIGAAPVGSALDEGRVRLAMRRLGRHMCRLFGVELVTEKQSTRMTSGLCGASCPSRRLAEGKNDFAFCGGPIWPANGPRIIGRGGCAVDCGSGVWGLWVLTRPPRAARFAR